VHRRRPCVHRYQATGEHAVNDKLLSEHVSTLSYHTGEGLVMIYDVSGLAGLLGLGVADLARSPGSVEDGDLGAPGPATRPIATRAAERMIDSVVLYLEREEGTLVSKL
jgi:hypothetical protein